MSGAPPSADERQRLRALTRLGLLHTPPEPTLDAFVELVTTQTGAHAGSLTLVTQDRAWSKAGTFGQADVPRSVSLAGRALDAKEGWATAHVEPGSALAAHPAMAGIALPAFAAACVFAPSSGERLGALELVWEGEPGPAVRSSLRGFTAHLGHLLALRAEAGEYGRFVELSPDPVVILDVDGTIVQANPALVRMLGVAAALEQDPAAALVGTTFLELVDRPDRTRVAAALARVLFAGSRPAQLDMGVRRVDGVVLPCTVSAAHLDGVHRHLQLIVHDLSDRHRAEEERSRLSEQLARAQRFDVLGQIAGGLAHDLNNLLAVMVSNLGLAQEALVELGTATSTGSVDAVTQDLDELSLAVERARSLTSRLLDFARKTDGASSVAHVGDVVGSVQRLTGRTLGTGAVLSVDVEDGLPPVAADPAKLERALVNLVMNARDALGEGGVVRIHARRAEPPFGANVLVEVADDGIGMGESVRARAFEPLFTTKSDRGSGLGLATVSALVDECDGSVTLDSAPGEGTRVTLLLPVADRSVPPVPIGLDVPVAGARILLVDPGERTRRVIAQMLQGVGYRVRAVRCAQEASSALAESRSDLLVTELALPDGGGTALIGAVREQYPELPVLVLASADAPSTVHGAPVLAKPFSHTRLLRSVESLLHAR